ncbi:hypothetical protein ACSBR1_004321 [Camellia fascicularis]
MGGEEGGGEGRVRVRKGHKSWDGQGEHWLELAAPNFVFRKDKSVVLCSIHDHVSTLTSDPSTKPTGSAGSIIKTTDNISIGPRGIFQGHEDTVEDVQFCPLSAQEFCSVGDDSCLILWDARVGTSPVFKVEKAHDADLHCVDWNAHDENLIITGSADNSVCMF